MRYANGGPQTAREKQSNKQTNETCEQNEAKFDD